MFKILFSTFLILSSASHALSADQCSDLFSIKSSKKEPYRIFIPGLKKARSQALPNCWYHSQTRTNEYVYQLHTGEKIYLAPNYFSANYLRLKGLEALDKDALDLKAISTSSWGSPQELQMRYGLMISDPQLSEKRVDELQVEISQLVEDFRARSQNLIGKKLIALREKYREQIDRLVDEAGGSPDQTFKVGSKTYTPRTLAQSEAFRNLKWTVVQVDDKKNYFDNLPTISNYQDVINVSHEYANQKIPIRLDHLAGKRHIDNLINSDVGRPDVDSIIIPDSTYVSYFGFHLESDNDLEQLIVDALSTDLPIQAVAFVEQFFDPYKKGGLKVKKGAKIPRMNWDADDHGIIIVGIERFENGRVTIYFQNSWGRNFFGTTGVVPADINEFKKVLLTMTFPVFVKK